MVGDVAKEVIDELDSRKTPAYQRAILIIAANAFGVLIGGGVLGFCGIVWSKSNQTDIIAQQQQRQADLDAASRAALLDEIAQQKATLNKLLVQLKASESNAPLLPWSKNLSKINPSSDEVKAAQESINQKLDKAVYRAKQMSVKE